MKHVKFYLMAALVAAATNTGFTSCSDDDDAEFTGNDDANEVVINNKKHDTAILLCTFGSTYNESLDVYDQIIKDFENEFGNEADIYLSFTSHTCIGRVEASTGIARYQAKKWLEAIGKAGYERVAVQSLHVIPGEEYLSLMNTDVKKDFMISGYPHINVLKGANLLADEGDVEEVADILYNHYAGQLKDKNSIVLLMGHGNPDTNYNANEKYADMQEALQARAANKNIFVGTVDYGDMLFWPDEMEETPVSEADINKDEYKNCMYRQLTAYLEKNNLKAEDVKIYLAPFMSIAGDHAHNDLWGLEALAEHGTSGDYYTNEVKLNTNKYSWRERLTHMGFQVQNDFESHPIGQAGADHGIASGCNIKALGSHADVRKVWLNHLKEGWNDADAWENGEGYQPEA